MKVKDLIELLEDFDPESKVYLMTQKQWPFEDEIKGVTSRSDFSEEDEDINGVCQDDVFIVQGRQKRYGHKEAWG